MFKRIFLWAKGLDKRLKFLFVGGLNTILGYGVYLAVLLSFGINLKLSIGQDKIFVVILANVLSTVLGVINSYFWNKYFTFESKEKTIIEKVKFVSVYAVATGLDTGLKALLNKYTNLNQYLIAALGILIVIFISYFGQRYFVFNKAVMKNEKIKNEEKVKAQKAKKSKNIKEEMIT